MSNEPETDITRITPIYETDWPNHPVTLTTEHAMLISSPRHEGDKEFVACGMIKIVMHWSPVRFHFEFEGEMIQEDSAERESNKLNFSYLGDIVRIETTTFIATGCITSYGNDEIDGVIDQPEVTCGNDDKLLAVTFHLANYTEISSSRIVQDRGTHDCGPVRDYSEIELNADGWRILVQPHRFTRELEWDAEKAIGNILNGIGQITRTNGEEFTISSVRNLIDALEYFLSFVLFQRMPLLLCVGSSGTKRRSWQLWRTKNVQYVYGHNLKTWVPICGGDLLSEAFTGFYEKWSTLEWHESLKLAIEWLLHAETQAAEENLNGAIAYAQIPFEMLASAASVEGHTAAEKIEQLLSLCQVSCETPMQCENLYALEKKTSYNSGPKLIARVRNTVIHPSKANRGQLIQWASEYGVSAEAIPGETYRLFKHYLILIVLHSIGYRGAYRTHLGGKNCWLDWQDQRVPWVGI